MIMSFSTPEVRSKYSVHHYQNLISESEIVMALMLRESIIVSTGVF